MSLSFKIATAWGIPIRIHISLIALLALVGIWAKAQEGWPSALWNVSLLAAVFASITLHELAHSLVAMRKGVRVRDITLLFIGGAAQMEEIPRKPADEIQVAIAGPLFSLGLAAVCWFGGALLPLAAPLAPLWGNRALNLAQLVGQINLSLALFNLLPAFPMDGGRILRAWMARKIGRIPATFVASRLGRVAAIIMGIVGFRNGWWGLMLIAVFLFRAAGREFEAVFQQEMRDTWSRLSSWTWPGGTAAPPPADAEPGGQVQISPPPYARGRPTVSDLYRDQP